MKQRLSLLHDNMMKKIIQYLYTQDQKIFGELKYTHTPFEAYKKHFHTHFGVALIDKGHLEITYDKDTTRYLDHQSIAIFNPQQIHRTKVVDAQGYYVLFLDKQWCQREHEHFYISESIIKEKDWYQAFKTLFDTILIPNHSVVESEVSEMIQDFFQKYGTLHTPKESNIITHIKSIIVGNSDTSFSVEQLAKEIGYDKSYLIRLFKKEVGMTPQQYILNTKVNRAKDLMTYTKGDSLSTISVDAGFFDQSHLNRNFKGLFGTSPKLYK